MSIPEIHQQYLEILSSDKSEIEQDEALAGLMTDMEREFSIPVLLNEEWETSNKAVSALYQMISNSRTTIW